MCDPHPRFADLERSLGESERARAVYELAIAQPVLDMPEVLWKVGRPGVLLLRGVVQLCKLPFVSWRSHSRCSTCRKCCGAWWACAVAGFRSAVAGAGLVRIHAICCTAPAPRQLKASHMLARPNLQAYIDFEIGEGNREGARELYERLLQRTRHVKVGAVQVKPEPSPCASWLSCHPTCRFQLAAQTRACCSPVCHACVLCASCCKACIGARYRYSQRYMPRRPSQRACSPATLPQVWLSYAKFEATPLAVLATPADEDEAQTEEERAQQLEEAVAAEGGEAGTGGAGGCWVDGWRCEQVRVQQLRATVCGHASVSD